jgi:hypothetical protein
MPGLTTVPVDVKFGKLGRLVKVIDKRSDHFYTTLVSVRDVLSDRPQTFALRSTREGRSLISLALRKATSGYRQMD